MKRGPETRWRIVVTEGEVGVVMAGEFGLPRNLEGMSVESLKAYRIALEAEIANVDAEISRRKGAIEGAHALFKSQS